MLAGVFYMYACLFVETYARVWLFMCLCVNLELSRHCVSLCMYLRVYMQMYVYECMECLCVYVYVYVHAKVRVYLNGSFLILWAGGACPFLVGGVKLSGFFRLTSETLAC